jgi:L-fuconolactonase
VSSKPLTVVDAHQHFWDPETGDYAWLANRPAQIRRKFDFEDVADSLARQSIDGTVLVQAADNDGDTDAMFEVAARHPQIVGIVGYVPLERPDVAAARLEELQSRGGLVGVRNLIHDQPDPDWLLRDDVAEGLRLLERAGLPLDVPAELPRHLEHVGYLSERFPALDVVVDHLAKPPVKSTQAEPWTTLIRRAAANPRVYAKVSGLYPAAGDWSDHGTEDLRPWVDTALEAFGPERLMLGSDWPVSVLAGGFDTVWGRLVELVTGYGPEVAAQLLGRTAVACYRLPASEFG